jgi:hypothetical protein
MSDSNDSTETTVLTGPVTMQEPAKLKIDPIVVLQQIETLRKEGVEEEVIRAAFAELMEEAQGRFRRPQVTLRKVPDMIPMPTQEETNKWYKDLVKESPDANNPNIQVIIEALERPRYQRTVWIKPTLKQRIAYYFLRKIIGVVVYIFKKLDIQ